MSENLSIDFAAIRDGMRGLVTSPNVVANEEITPDQVYFPEGHRGVLDLKRQLVVGNRGMGKSFWTHALLNPDVRKDRAKDVRHSVLANTNVVLGFNGSDKKDPVAPTNDEISQALKQGYEPDLIWRAVLLRAALQVTAAGNTENFDNVIRRLIDSHASYSEVLTKADTILSGDGKFLLIVFDALDRLAIDWQGIRNLTKALLVRAIGLQSFRSIRAKIFMRVDQFDDIELFRFPDSSKIRNDHVSLKWESHELYGLLFFELLRKSASSGELKKLVEQLGAHNFLTDSGQMSASALREQELVVTRIAGEFMGSDKKRGRVYTWVPLHLSDAANTCSPRTFFTAWKQAADHVPQPSDNAVDHLGLKEGVRKASENRLGELQEDYPWILPTLEALRGELVPMPRSRLFELWASGNVLETIKQKAKDAPRNTPVGFAGSGNGDALLSAMKSVAVMEERANGKINVPDIYRIKAGIKRKGGVTVPRQN